MEAALNASRSQGHRTDVIGNGALQE